MFYRNLKLKKKVISLSENFTNFASGMDTTLDQSLMPYRIAKLTYNFNIKNGVLKTGYGFKKLKLPLLGSDGFREIVVPNGEVKRVWFYRYYDEDLNCEVNMLLFYMSGGDIYGCQIKAIALFASRL